MRSRRLRKIRRSNPNACQSTLSIIAVITEFWQPAAGYVIDFKVGQSFGEAQEILSVAASYWTGQNFRNEWARFFRNPRLLRRISQVLRALRESQLHTPFNQFRRGSL
jgi:hypothetical protein